MLPRLHDASATRDRRKPKPHRTASRLDNVVVGVLRLRAEAGADVVGTRSHQALGANPVPVPKSTDILRDLPTSGPGRTCGQIR